MTDWMLWPALALLAGTLALVPLGRAVLDRGVVFIDLAVAQAAAAATLWSMAFIGHESDWALDLAGVGGALLCASGVAFIHRRWPGQREALIGLLYVLGACLALLGARQDAHGRERLLELLAADVLWARPSGVVMLGMAACSVLWLNHWRPDLLRRDTWFFGLFAVVVSIAVPLLGLFLVFALLIAPALWLQRASGLPLWAGLVAGIAGSMAGLALSWVVDLPSGPCVALCLAVLGLGALFRPTALEASTRAHSEK